MTLRDPSQDDARLADLLATLDATAAPPDQAMLAGLRVEAGAVFESTPGQPSQEVVHSQAPGTWRRKMLRSGMVAAAAVILLGLSLVAWWKPVSGPSLAEIFAQVEARDAFAATYWQGQTEHRLYFARPAMLRLESVEHPENYILVRNGQAWAVDEAKNQATPAVNTALMRAGSPNLAGLLRLPQGLDASQLQPTKQIQQEGEKRTLTYEVGPSRWRLDITLGAFATVEELELHDPASPRRLKLWQINPPVQTERFQLKDTLTEDGRVGHMMDIQGVVSVRPAGHDRWTPLAVGDLLKPGDLVRSDPRGPNAGRVRLVPNTDLTFGPGATLDVKSPTELRLLAGDIEVHPRGRKIQIGGPVQETVTIEAKTLLRIADEKLTKLTDAPAWLKGFQGTVANESLGSLLANVDGRNVPLNVGYHKVDVDIRDGLARTTVEESFVNTTNTDLEGTFYFPLPADASIAGFGMWIGNDLVEADVVEKQRAREIFDIILSEKKDPGLLEWSGGNLFKTRVYPIPARGEKRIKITYTQALPLEGQRFRYSYALLSDLLKQHPLRRLDVTVTVNSSQPLARVYSPTHPTREEKTGAAARLAFTAQEYTPARDFEAVVELASKPAPVTLIPHRRGDDGYFLLRIHPPGGSPGWERDLVRDGAPLHLLILCDTSASIDKHRRQQQAAFVTALLGSLTPNDTFNLACADVETTWVFPQAVAAEAKHITAAEAVLQGRKSLGWTDLEKALATAMKQAGPHTQIIYLGDGTPATSLGHDPQVFVDRFKTVLQRGRAVHAVALGSTHESMVLKAMATLSGGSWRRITADRGPAQQARDLLLELTDPNLLRDLSVTFAGVKVATVYPETLPNVRAGSEVVLTGRYLPRPLAASSPAGGETKPTGKIVFSGRMGDKPVRFTQDILLPDAPDAGSSFIPRLWARQRIEHLLETGGAAARDEIIARAEEFHLMTPYTSFLVLENDAMRERFAVKRRFGMRDGERFFAEGRSQSQLLLRQKQMRLAGDWRVGLRRQALAQYAQLGRVMPPAPSASLVNGVNSNTAENLEFGELLGDSLGWRTEINNEKYPVGVGGGLGGEGLVGGGLGGGGFGGRGLSDVLVTTPTSPSEASDLSLYDLGRSPTSEILARVQGRTRDLDFNVDQDERNVRILPNHLSDEQALMSKPLQWGGEHYRDFSRQQQSMLTGLTGDGEFTNELDMPISGDSLRQARLPMNGYGGLGGYSGSHPLGLSRIFPVIPPIYTQPQAKPPVWSPEIVEIIRSLNRRTAIEKLKNTHLVLDRVTESYDPRRNQLSSQTKRIEYVSDQRWLVRQEGDGISTTVEWCDAKERGLLNLTFLTGRTRPSAVTERRRPTLALPDHSLEDLAAHYGQWQAKLDHLDGQRVRITLRQAETKTDLRWDIDTVRHVLLREETSIDGKLQSSAVHAEFHNVADLWWAGRVSQFDGRGKLTTQTIQQVQSVGAELLQGRWTQELKEQPNCLTLPQPLPPIDAAKEGAAGGKGSVIDHIVLMAYFTQSQQWTRVKEHFAQVERLAGDKAATRWLRVLVLLASRNNEAVRQLVREEADRLVKTPRRISGDDWSLASFLQENALQVGTGQEDLEFLAKIKPVYQRQPGHRRALRAWTRAQARALDEAGYARQALTLFKQLAEGDLDDFSVQWEYFTHLINAGELDIARDWYLLLLQRGKLDLGGEFSEWETQFWHELLSAFQRRGRARDLLALSSMWAKRRPEQPRAQHWYLASLILTEQQVELDRTLEAWIAAGPGAENSAQSARFQAAFWTVSQNNPAFYSYYREIPEKYFGLVLAQAAKLLTDPHQIWFVNETLGSAAGESAAGMKLRRSLVARLHDQAATLPRGRLAALVGHVVAYATAVEEAEQKEQGRLWGQIVPVLRHRWEQAKEKQEKHDLGNILAQVLSSRDPSGTYVTFLRERIDAEHADYRSANLNALFVKLQSMPWSLQLESELLSLIPKLGDTLQLESVRLYPQVQFLMPLVDHLVAARQRKLWSMIPEPGKLTRKQIIEKQQETMRQARRELAARFQDEAARGGPLAPWFTAELLYLRTLAEDNLPDVAAATWAALDRLPPPLKLVDFTAIASAEQWTQARSARAAEMLWSLLRARHLAVLGHLATRTVTQVAVADRLVTYLDKMVETQPVEPSWKRQLYQLLVALDRPEQLETRLRQWIRAELSNQRWRVALAYLQAERGGLTEAVQLLEEARIRDELRPAEWRALGEWYLALDQKDRHEQAREHEFETMPEERLARWLQQQAALVSRQSDRIPGVLDEDTFRVIPTLLRKSQSPGNYTQPLQALYQTTRDFRLLAGMAEAIPGQSPGRVYPMLRGWLSVLNEVRDEATVDELSKKLQEVRRQARTAVDQRALDLLELLIHRRAAELQNQPGPHAEQAATALERSLQHVWTPDEPALMAELLADLGRIATPTLKAKQWQAFAVLQRRAPPGTPDRARVDLHLARTLWSYDQHEQAIKLLQTDVAEVRAKDARELLPTFAQPVVDELLRELNAAGRQEEAERFVNAELAHPGYAAPLRDWWKHHLYDIYLDALTHRKTLTLGGGEVLFHAAQTKFLEEAGPERPADFRAAMFQRLDRLYCTAFDLKLPGVKDACCQAILERYPPLLATLFEQRIQIASGSGDTLRHVVGYNEAAAFLLNEYDRTPPARRRQGEAWQMLHPAVTEWRRHVTSVATLDRLFRIVADLLVQDLAANGRYGGGNYGNEVYNKGGTYFWSAKEEAIASAALAAYAAREPSPNLALRVAGYLHDGLQHTAQAADLLHQANRQKMLNEEGRYALTGYLMELKRYGEAIPELRRLLAANSMLRYHLRLMGAYFHAGQHAELRAMLAATEKRFAPQGQWTTSDLERVALTTYETHLFLDTVRLYDILIPQFRREHEDRDLDQGTIWDYYRRQALALVEVGETGKALDAISAAIVLGGRSFAQRADVLDSLRDVLRRSKDIPTVVAHLDSEAKQNQGRENPILRRALAEVLLERQQRGAAVTQLRQVLELNPDDTQAYTLLISAYDQLGQKADAAEAAYQLAEARRREPAVWKDLGRRNTELRQSTEAERAYTTIVELLPGEADAQIALAQVREEQSRWDAAITHWKLAVQFRAEDPAGLLGLFPALIYQKRWDEAAKALDQLRNPTKPWHRRFDALQLPTKVQAFEQQLKEANR